MELLVSLGQLLVSVGLVVLIALVIILFWSLARLQVPFVPSSKKVSRELLKVFDIKDNSVVYDLGTGDGRVLFACYKHNPKARYIGIEYHALPLALAKLRRYFAGNKTNITFIKADLFKTDLSKATHIYTYLSPRFMDLLLPKFKRELRPGTRVISCDFYFTEKKPDMVVPLGSPTRRFHRELYIYTF